jgi:hypothetical protein
LKSRKEKRGKRKEERGKRKEERGKRKEERGAPHPFPLLVPALDALPGFDNKSNALPDQAW